MQNKLSISTEHQINIYKESYLKLIKANDKEETLVIPSKISSLDGKILFYQIKQMLSSDNLKSDLNEIFHYFKYDFHRLANSITSAFDSKLEEEKNILTSLPFGKRDILLEVLPNYNNLETIRQYFSANIIRPISLSLDPIKLYYYGTLVKDKSVIKDKIQKTESEWVTVLKKSFVKQYIEKMHSKLKSDVEDKIGTTIKKVDDSLNIILDSTNQKLFTTKIKYGLIQNNPLINLENVSREFKNIDQRLRRKQRLYRGKVYLEHSNLDYKNISVDYLLTFDNQPLLQHYESFNEITEKGLRESYIYIYHKKDNAFTDNVPGIFMFDGTRINKEGVQVLLLGKHTQTQNFIIGSIVTNSYTAKCYQKVFSYFKNNMMISKESYVVSDFEMSILSSLKAEKLNHQACYFHYCQLLSNQKNAYTKICRQAYKKTVNIPTELQKYLKYLLFVPFSYREDYIKTGLQVFKDELVTNLASQQLFLYAHDFCLIGKHRAYSYCNLDTVSITTNNFIESKNAQLKYYKQRKSSISCVLSGIERLYLPRVKNSKFAPPNELTNFHFILTREGIAPAINVITKNSKFDINFPQGNGFVLDMKPWFKRKIDPKSIFEEFFCKMREHYDKDCTENFKRIFNEILITNDSKDLLSISDNTRTN